MKERGVWAVLDYWLQRTEEFLGELWVKNRVAMIARYDTGLGLKRPIDRFMRSEDPFGTLEFVEFGVSRGEIRGDVDAEMIASMLDWLAERFQDALGEKAGLDPGLVPSATVLAGATRRSGSTSSSRSSARRSRRPS